MKSPVYSNESSSVRRKNWEAAAQAAELYVRQRPEPRGDSTLKVLLTIFSASAANWDAVKATNRGRPVVAEVVFKCTTCSGSLPASDGGDWPGSNGHTTWPDRQARSTSRMKPAECPAGKAAGPERRGSRSIAERNSANVQRRLVVKSTRASPFGREAAVLRQQS